jgi:predicted dienelactone hydrolase
MQIRYVLSLILLLPLAAIGQTPQIFIGEQTLRFKDTARNRPLTTEVWYPTTDNSRQPTPKKNYPFITDPTIWSAQLPAQKHPLVMISHGTGGGGMTMEWLADALVKQGFIVAAVNHWGNTYDNKIAINFVTPWHRAQDISYVLTQLLNHPELSKVIDQEHIGAAGFSIGGYTVIALAGGKLNIDALDDFSKTPQGIAETTIPEFPNLMNSVKEEDIKASFAQSPPLKDDRIKAFFAICPAIGQGFTKASQLKDVKKPIYIVGTEGDIITPVKTNAAHYHNLIPKSQYYMVKGNAGHYVFLNEATTVVKQSGDMIFNDAVGVDRHAVHELIGGMAAAFFNANLKK